jgi:hypothetical protein
VPADVNAILVGNTAAVGLPVHVNVSSTGGNPNPSRIIASAAG